MQESRGDRRRRGGPLSCIVPARRFTRVRRFPLSSGVERGGPQLTAVACPPERTLDTAPGNPLGKYH